MTLVLAALISSHEGFHRNRVFSIGPKEVSEQSRITQVLSVLNLVSIYFGLKDWSYFRKGLEAIVCFQL